MADHALEAEIDRLYQLPLEQFTAARNALAKRVPGNAAKLGSWTKPTAPAWAVNQVYWRSRATFDALLKSARSLRSAHRALLGGKAADVRGADAGHRQAVGQALAAALKYLEAGGQTATPATRQAILQTLESLTDELPPGRLTRVLQPAGLEALSGITTAAPGRTPPRVPARPSPEKGSEHEIARARRDLDAAKARLEEARRQAKSIEAVVKRLTMRINSLRANERSAREAWERAGERLKGVEAEFERERQSASQATAAVAAAEHDLDRAVTHFKQLQ